jgi:putative photosynthetic complex assembly protein
MSAIPTSPSGRAPDNFPRAFLYGAGALIAFSLISVGIVRITGNGPDQKRAAQAAAGHAIERSLRFEDRPDGSIAVVDAASGQVVASFEGEQGFVRGALRALARERKASGLGAEVPFELIARPEGGLTLLDPLTGQRIDLGSFGPSHAAAFANLLTGQVRPDSRR